MIIITILYLYINIRRYSLLGKMSARTNEEKSRVAGIKGKSPRNRSRRNSIIIAMRESKERHRSKWLENEDVRAELNKKQTIFDEYFRQKASKEPASTPNNRGKPESEDCEFCESFRSVASSTCLNCGKPLGK